MRVAAIALLLAATAIATDANAMSVSPRPMGAGDPFANILNTPNNQYDAGTSANPFNITGSMASPYGRYGSPYAPGSGDGFGAHYSTPGTAAPFGFGGPAYGTTP